MSISRTGRSWLAVVAAVSSIMMAAPSLSAQAPGGPFARAKPIPAGPVTVGQPIRIEVTVFVPSYFTGAPRFASIDVPGALTLFRDRGANMTERVDGTLYAGQSRSYMVFPQRAGSYDVGEISVEVSYFDDNLGSTIAEVRAPAVSFEAALPPEAEGLAYFISTTQLTLTASYNPKPDTISVGDAFRRTITAEVVDALAMLIPPLATNPVRGLAIYPEPPIVADAGGERGEAVRGTRTEIVSVVAQDAGEYTLPGMSLSWWDVGAGAMKSARVDDVRFVVVEAPSAAAFELEIDSTATVQGEAAGASSLDIVGLARRILPPTALLLFLFWIGVRAWRRFGAVWIERRAARIAASAESESTYFDRLRTAAETGDARAVLNALYGWYDRARPSGSSAAVFDWIAALGDAELKSQYDSLMRAVREPTSDYHGAKLVHAIERIRSRASNRRSNRSILPPLNPTHAPDARSHQAT